MRMCKGRLLEKVVGFFILPSLCLYSIAINSPTKLQSFSAIQEDDPPANFTKRSYSANPSCPSGFFRPFHNESASVTNSSSFPFKKVPKVYHLSAKFGKNLAFQQEVLSHEDFVRSTQMFDGVMEHYKFPNFILNDPAVQQYLTFLKPRWLYYPHKKTHHTQRGAGYWFWKSELIYHYLQHTLEEGDFLVYSDTDLIDHLQILPFLLPQMVSRQHNAAFHRMWQPHRNEQVWTKRDVYEAYCPNKDLKTDQSRQMDAMFVVLRKDAATLQFAQQFRVATRDYHALTDRPSYLPNYDFFRIHRRDQSLLNLIVKCRYSDAIPMVYNHSCQWRPVETFSLVARNETELRATIQDTSNRFKRQKRLHQRSTRKQRSNASDIYWSLY